jgi:hypothetical protein
MLIRFSKWVLMGQRTGEVNDDENQVVPSEWTQIEELKDHMEEGLYVDMSRPVGSGWKLR